MAAAQKIVLSDVQLQILSGFVLGKLDEIEAYYSKPENMEKYRAWFREYYGREPMDWE